MAVFLLVFFIESADWTVRVFTTVANPLFKPGVPPQISSQKPGAMSAALSTTALLVLLGSAWLRVWLGMAGDQTAFLAGVRDRLNRDVDPKQLQNWAIGVMPDTPPKVGFPIHLSNGQTVNSEQPNGDGSLSLSPSYLPPNVNALFPRPPGILVKYDTIRPRQHVKIGFFGDRFGLIVEVGRTNYVYDGGLSALRWRDGIYVSIAGGG